MMVAPQESDAAQGEAGATGEPADSRGLGDDMPVPITGVDYTARPYRTVPGTAVPLPAPKEPTAYERAKHMLTH